MKRICKRAAAAAVLLLLLCVLGGWFYVSDYYPATEEYLPALAVSDSISVSTADSLTFLTPENPNGTGLIFYPGGKVEHTAYLPLLEKLCNQGITCALAEMPFRLAVLNPNAADAVPPQLPYIERWYIGGHSLGGAMASHYAAEHPNAFEGVILLGAYLYGDWPAEKALTLYGSEDRVLDRSKITYTENVVILEGGNHAQFGCYGLQEGDGTATITAEQQQALTVQAILNFISGT